MCEATLLDTYLSKLKSIDNLYFNLVDQAPDAVIVIDETGFIQSANKISRAIFEGDEGPLEGKCLLDLVPMSKRRVLSRAIGRLISSESGLEEIVLDEGCLAGTLYPVTLSACNRSRDVTRCVVCVFRHEGVRRARQGQDAERAIRQRDLLVREVHHRIKNHLQALVGLVSVTFSSESGLDQRAQGLLSQIHSIAVIHGLQSKRADELVNLCDTVAAIGELNESLRGSGGCLHLRIELDRPAVIVESHAVAIALVVNELIRNAMKHSCRKNESIAVLIRSGCFDDSVELVIRNPGAIDENVLTDLQESGACGGLSLVHELLPAEGARLHVENRHEGGYVETLLELSPPVVSSVIQEGFRP